MDVTTNKKSRFGAYRFLALLAALTVGLIARPASADPEPSIETASAADAASAVFLSDKRPIAFHVGPHQAIGIELTAGLDPARVSSQSFFVKDRIGNAVPGAIRMVNPRKYLFKPQPDLALNASYDVFLHVGEGADAAVAKRTYTVYTQATVYTIYGAKGTGTDYWRGNLKTRGGGKTGVGGADNLCSTNQYRPDTSGKTVYKALIAAPGQRVACADSSCRYENSLNWVLKPNTTYNNSFTYFYPNDYPSTAIGTTTSGGVFTFPLSAALDYQAGTWTGLNSNWTTNGDTCNGWTSDDKAYMGHWGSGNSHPKDSGSISINSTNCNDTWLFIVCAEQPATAIAATKDSAGQIPVDTRIEIEFGYDVDAATVNTTTVTLTVAGEPAAPAVPGTITGSRSSYEFAPAHPLRQGATYTVAVGPGVIDGVGNGVPAATYTFTTALDDAVLIAPPLGERRQVPLDSSFTEQYPADTDGATVTIALYEKGLPASDVALALADPAALEATGDWNSVAVACDPYNATAYTKTCRPEKPLDADSLLKVVTTFKAFNVDVTSTGIAYVTTATSHGNSVWMTRPYPRSNVAQDTAINLFFRGPGAPDPNDINTDTVRIAQTLEDGTTGPVSFKWQMIDNATLMLKPTADLAANATVTVTVDDLRLTDDTYADYTGTFTTTAGPVLVLPYPQDKMSLNGEIEIQYPPGTKINKSTVNSKTFTVTDTVTGEQVAGLYQVLGNVISFVRTGGGLWSAGRSYAVYVSAEITDVQGTGQPAVATQVTTVAGPADRARTIFEVGNSYTAAEIDGLRNADRLCNNDPNKPQIEGVWFKALLGARETDIQDPRRAENERWGADRRWVGDAIGHRNWVLLPNVTYFTADGQLIGTTNGDSVFQTGGTLANPIDAAVTEGSWSGLNIDWGVRRDNRGRPQDCNGWTGLWRNYLTPPDGSLGNHSDRNVNNMLDSTFLARCDDETRYTFACVEQ